MQVDFGVAYDADLAEVEALAVSLMRETEGVLLEEEGKEPMCVVMNWGASSVDHAARCWTKNEDFWGVKFELQRKLKEALDAKGIEIPFPQRVVVCCLMRVTIQPHNFWSFVSKTQIKNPAFEPGFFI